MLSASIVSDLQGAAAAAHQTFSDAHARLKAAEAELLKAAAVRSSLVRRLNGARQALVDARRAVIGAAISGEGFSEASANILALQGELSLLDTALRHYHAFAYCDAQRAALAAKVLMLEKQHSSERTRLAHHVASLQVGLAEVAARNGGSLNVEMSGAVRGFEELIARIGRELDGARNELRRHDEEARGSRELYEQDKSK
jgi:membrane carboxypeptidase/penicillin-binding protein PbpC